MGYWTNFTFNMWDKDDQWIEEDSSIYEKVCKKFEEVTDIDSGEFEEMYHYALTTKWYEWEEDMKKIVADFPDIKFEIEGYGEDRTDWWIAQWYNGEYAIEYAVPPKGKLFKGEFE